MSSELKPIKLYGAVGPNPPKIAIILQELHLPFEVVKIPYNDVKNPEYVAINPNGRLPAITDPNKNDLTIWESGAIIEYLTDTYDTEHSISFKQGTPEYWHARQWLYYQTTGQGPYYGQAAWFKKFHSEKLPSALDRYLKELARVSNVLEGWLAKQKEENPSTDGPWLVGDRISYADIAFVQWQRVIGLIISKEEYDMGTFPLLNAWYEKIMARDAVKKGLERCA